MDLSKFSEKELRDINHYAHLYGGWLYLNDKGDARVRCPHIEVKGGIVIISPEKKSELGTPFHLIEVQGVLKAEEGETHTPQGPFYSEVNSEGVVAVWLALPERDFPSTRKLWVEDGYLYSRAVRLREGGQLFDWWNANSGPGQPYVSIWRNRATYTKVVRVCESGRGYSGGHNSAVRYGWVTSRPAPHSHAVLWWDSSTEGRFQGYYPETTSLVADQVVYKGGRFFRHMGAGGECGMYRLTKTEMRAARSEGINLPCPGCGRQNLIKLAA